MRVLAIDPGRTSGVVAFDASGIATIDAVFFSAQVKYEDFFGWFDETLNGRRKLDYDAIVLERFHITMRTIRAARVEDTLDVIGAVKCLSAIHAPRSVPVVRQNASDAKTAYPDAKLKSLGLWTVGKHSRDAMRHGLLYTHGAFKR